VLPDTILAITNGGGQTQFSFAVPPFMAEMYA